MKAKVYVVVTYHGYHGDEVRVFGREAEAEACVLEYARDCWNSDELGPMPTRYSELCEAWGDNDLWGSTNSRWDLEEREVELPAPGPDRGPRRASRASPRDESGRSRTLSRR
jgi:hypothetical protein